MCNNHIALLGILRDPNKTALRVRNVQRKVALQLKRVFFEMVHPESLFFSFFPFFLFPLFQIFNVPPFFDDVIGNVRASLSVAVAKAFFRMAINQRFYVHRWRPQIHHIYISIFLIL